MNNVHSDVSKRILIFLLSEFLLVVLISIPLFLLKVENGSGLVMAASVIFMWLPALATFLTRKITNDKSELPLKPLIKKNRNDKIFFVAVGNVSAVFFLFVGV